MVNVTDVLAFEEYDSVVLTSLLYRESTWDFGTDYQPVTIELSAYSVTDADSEINPTFNKLEVMDLSDPIYFTLPKDSGIDLSCAYLDSTIN